MTPSLKALQAVEATARTGSFAAAAEELSVTPAAVGQLVRSLERRLGRELFVRVSRGVVPSEAAHEILPRLRAVFAELNALSGALVGRVPPSRLSVSVPNSIASGWLGRRVGDFVAATAGPSPDLSLRSDEDPVAFERDRIDVRMSYGPFHYRGHETREVLLDAVYPVCSPAFLARHGGRLDVADVHEVPLVHTDWGPAAATFPSWSRFLESAGVDPPARRPSRGSTANTSMIALELAATGLGVALVQGLLAAGPLTDGTLVLASRHAMPLGQPYCLTLADGSLERDIVVRFDAWFREECAASVARVRRIVDER